MTDFSVQTAVTGRKIDSRWRASRHGHGTARPGQIDASKFTGEHVVDGVIPSGVALSQLPSGLYGPWDSDAVEGAEQSVLDGFIDDESGVVLSSKATIAVLKHGDIAVPYLPIEAQREGIRDAKTTGLFTFQED